MTDNKYATLFLTQCIESIKDFPSTRPVLLHYFLESYKLHDQFRETRPTRKMRVEKRVVDTIVKIASESATVGDIVDRLYAVRVAYAAMES